MRSPVLWILAVLAAVAFAASGCGEKDSDGSGSDSATTYETEVATALAPVIIETGRISVDLRAIDSTAQFALQAAALAKRYSGAAIALDSIAPPDDVAELHDELVKATDELAAQTARAAKKLRESQGLGAFRDAATAYRKRLAELEAEFSEAGYAFP